MRERLRTELLTRSGLRLFSAVSCALVILLSLPQASRCQVLDDLTAQGKSVLQGLDLTPDMVSAIQQRAESGDAKAQYVLGWMYFVGSSVDKNHEEALRWMTRAAAQDVRYAKTQTGLMFLASSDVQNNYALAREWLLKGAEQNDVDAWNGLGVIYSQGLGVEVRADEAVRFFQKAVDKGFDKAQYNLGYLYATRKVLPRDLKESARLFQLAADQDHVRATYSLGVMYRDGEGVPQDLSKAVELFQKAAEKYRFAPAQHNLGAMYYTGKGLPRDLISAYMWVNLAAGTGFEPSKKLLQTISEKMSAQEVDAAKAKTEAWVKTHGS
jgi:TPR repeat protein